MDDGNPPQLDVCRLCNNADWWRILWSGPGNVLRRLIFTDLSTLTLGLAMVFFSNCFSRMKIDEVSDTFCFQDIERNQAVSWEWSVMLVSGSYELYI